MIKCIVQELIEKKEYLEKRIVETIYFGGGTPSLLEKDEIELFIRTIKKYFDCSETIEITLESNPDDITVENLVSWKEAGINRLSIGLQSFKESDLEWMNRAHTVEESKKCISLAQNAGYKNLTVDLIYGLPNLQMSEWENHILKLIDKGVPHISAYCLTVESKTVLKNWVDKGKVNLPSSDVQSDQFLRLIEIMEANGYIQYEISNFCKIGFESKHNSNYWKNEWYLGVGPSAHSFNSVSRAWNVAHNRNYIKLLQKGENYSEIEVLSKFDQFNEMILTGLRTSYGVNLGKLNSIIEPPSSFHSKCAEFSSKGWLTIVNDLLTLTKEGKLKADYIASELFIDWNQS